MTSSKPTAFFEGETKAMEFVATLGLYENDARLKRLQCMSVVQQTINFWRRGVPAGGMFDCVI